MPIYDMRCPEGDGYYPDIICSIKMRHQQACPACGEFLVIVPPPISVVGPMPSKPLKIDQIGRSFESNEELRQYKRENPNARFQNKQEFRKHKDEVRERCERSARRQGFTDLEEKRSHLRQTN